MNDDLERRLDEFYRKLGPPSSRLAARWKAQGRARPSFLRRAALAGAAAAAAAVALLALAPRAQRPSSEPPLPSPAPVARTDNPGPAPAVHPKSDPPPTRAPAPPSPPPAPPDPAATRPQERPERAPGPPAPRLPTPAPAGPEKPSASLPPAGRTVEAPRPAARVPETEGTFDVGERAIRTRQKDFAFAAGDTVRAHSVVRLQWAEDQFILLAPASVLEIRPPEDGLVLGLEKGELVLEHPAGSPAPRVVTRACEVRPESGSCLVKALRNRTQVTVERGRTEVRTPRGRAVARAGQAVTIPDDGPPSEPVPADPRAWSWTRGHRSPERLLFFEDFSKPGAWDAADFDGGAARGRPQPPTFAGVLLTSSQKPPLFEVPLRGLLTLVYRSDRAAKMYVQFFADDVRANFRREFHALRGSAWRTVTLDFDDFVSTSPERHSGRVPPGSPVTTFGIYYGEGESRGAIWVDSVRIIELRP